ncbi:N-terminal acetyltransferase A complex auxiliary subunit NAA15 isoform X2 [Lactuca sativa]|nr:N-terminal acetyltransferase A complex auxiliary subunit NAA15 isoform X2 [Lactuca sativa]
MNVLRQTQTDPILKENQTSMICQWKKIRFVVAEMIYCLEPNKKAEAITLIQESLSNSPISSIGSLGGSVKEWKLKDCVAVHKILVSTFDDRDAALRWKKRCGEEFPYSTYFEGSLCYKK